MPGLRNVDGVFPILKSLVHNCLRLRPLPPHWVLIPLGSRCRFRPCLWQRWRKLPMHPSPPENCSGRNRKKEKKKNHSGRKGLLNSCLTLYQHCSVGSKKENKVRLAEAPAAAKPYIVVSLQLLQGVQTNQIAHAKKVFAR